MRALTTGLVRTRVRLLGSKAGSPQPVHWLSVRSAAALSTASGTSVTWWGLRECDALGPIPRLERRVSKKLNVEVSCVLHAVVTCASARAVLGSGGSLALILATAIGGMFLPVLTPAALVNYAVENSVTVKEEDARTIRQRLNQVSATGLSLCGNHLLDEAALQKLSKALWWAAAGMREEDGDAEHISRGALDALREHAASGAADCSEIRCGELRVRRSTAFELASAVFDLYDVDADGAISYVEFSTGILTLLSLLSVGGVLAPPPAQRWSEAQLLDVTFACLDVDGSGFLEPRELTAWVKLIRRLGGALPQDAPRDALGFPRAGVDSVVAGWLRECDTDHDGRISRDEFMALGPKLQLRKVVRRLVGESGGAAEPGSRESSPV